MCFNANWRRCSLLSVAALLLGSAHRLAAQSPLPATASAEHVAAPVAVEMDASPLRFEPSNRRFFAEVGATVLARTNPIDTAVVINEDTQATLLTTNDLSFDPEFGAMFRFGFWLNDGAAIEAIYFGLNDFVSLATVVGDNDLSLPGDLPLATYDFFAADVMSVRYASDVHNVEVNGRYLVHPFVTLLAGVRYVNLSEDFTISSTDLDTGTSDYDLNAYNHLVGGQVGTVIGPRIGRFAGGLVGKAGIFGNFAGQNSFVGDRDNQDVLRDASVRSYGGAFMLEGGVEGSVQLSESIAVHVGYKYIWFDRVLLAPDHLDFTDTPASGLAIDDDGDTALHGAFASIQYRWGRPRR